MAYPFKKSLEQKAQKKASRQWLNLARQNRVPQEVIDKVKARQKSKVKK